MFLNNNNTVHYCIWRTIQGWITILLDLKSNGNCLVAAEETAGSQQLLQEHCSGEMYDFKSPQWSLIRVIELKFPRLSNPSGVSSPAPAI